LEKRRAIILSNLDKTTHDSLIYKLITINQQSSQGAN